MNFMLLSIKSIIIIIIIIITEHGFSMLGFSPMEFFWPVPKKIGHKLQYGPWTWWLRSTYCLVGD